MRIFIYKRTHVGDPDAGGCFGAMDCMGPLRHLEFDAVIGIGGLSAEAVAHGIAGKLNWVGIDARKKPGKGRGPLVIFRHFQLWEERGPRLETVAPALAKRFFAAKAPRFLLDGLTDEQNREAHVILSLAAHAPASLGFVECVDS